tara:strand:- start:785 stop:1186 length:402 start_codon:yes stop_codon:yes gene_type:complete
MSLFKSDGFAGEPYGFTTNQISHAVAVGFLGLVYGVTFVWFVTFGEFPYKWVLIVFAGVAYAAYELIDQGWNGWDTIEDWWFVNVYGVIGPVMTFSEVEPGSALFTGSILVPIPFVFIFYAHLGFGAYVRSRQ